MRQDHQLGTLAFARFGRGHAAYGRLGVPGLVGLVAVGAGSVLIAYWKVKGYAELTLGDPMVPHAPPLRH